MNNHEFNAIVGRRRQKIADVLDQKAQEYSRGDRLSNFKRAAAAMQVTPERALLGMMMKHWVSIMDMIDDLDGGLYHLDYQWDEKIGDSINYLILLEGLVMERQSHRQSCLVKDEKGKKK